MQVGAQMGEEALARENLDAEIRSTSARMAELQDILADLESQLEVEREQCHTQEAMIAHLQVGVYHTFRVCQ